MKKALRRARLSLWIFLVGSTFLLTPLYAGNDVMGELQ